jgi:hypothetical protein
MGNFSIHDISPINVNLVEDSDSDLENSTMTRMSSKMQNYFIVTFNCLFVFV